MRAPCDFPHAAKLISGEEDRYNFPQIEALTEGKADAASVYTEDESLARRARFAAPLPTLGGLIRALQAGRSTALSVFGDFAGDSSDTNADAARLPERFVRRLCAKFPGHHVLNKMWNPTTEDHGDWVTMQTQAAARRFYQFNGRSMRYVEAVATQFTGARAVTTANLRATIQPTSWRPAAIETLITRTRKLVDGALSNELQLRFDSAPVSVR